MNRTLVFLDAAHGGPDAGAHLGDQLEKDLTLVLVGRLRSALVAEGFTVTTTRDADPPTLLTPDERAGIANRAHPVACVVVHATTGGTGVHLYTSTLAPADALDEPDSEGGRGSDYGLGPLGGLGPELALADATPGGPVPWERAQGGSVRQSLHLERDIGTALKTSSLPVLAGRAALRPLDNLMCPAVAVELAPLTADGSATPATDAQYQQLVIDALARALLFWRGHADAPPPPVKARPADWMQVLPGDQGGASGKPSNGGRP
jgi:N-acetylmuramoyl-L-alanine amidase